MPLRTAKPFFRIDSTPEGHTVTHYRTIGIRKFVNSRIKVMGHDQAAFVEQVSAWIDNIPGRQRRQEK